LHGCGLTVIDPHDANQPEHGAVIDIMPQEYERALLAITVNQLCSPETALVVRDRQVETMGLFSSGSLKLPH